MNENDQGGIEMRAIRTNIVPVQFITFDFAYFVYFLKLLFSF